MSLNNIMSFNISMVLFFITHIILWNEINNIVHIPNFYWIYLLPTFNFQFPFEKYFFTYKILTVTIVELTMVLVWFLSLSCCMTSEMCFSLGPHVFPYYIDEFCRRSWPCLFFFFTLVFGEVLCPLTLRNYGY